MARWAEEEAKRCPSSFFFILIGHMGAEEGGLTCMTMRRSKTRMKEARKARETSSLGRKPRFRLSQLIQSVLMTKTTTDVREMSTVLQQRRGGKGRTREGQEPGGGKEEESINDGRKIKIGGGERKNQLRRGAVTDIKTHKTLKAQMSKFQTE